MNDNIARLGATAIIWTAATLITVTMAITNSDLGVFPLGIIMGAAMVATIPIWESGRHKSESNAEREAEKNKRRSRVERMLSNMDERELEELRTRLVDNDGEMVGLEEVLRHRK